MKATYRSLSGLLFPAAIARRAGDLADITVDVGCRDHVELRRVAVVPPAELRNGTCAVAERGVGDGEAEAGAAEG